jgi:hypothetical protein
MKVYITPEAKQRLQLYIDAVDGEISGLGTVTVYGDRMIIDDVLLLEQESTHSSTDLAPGAVDTFLTEFIGGGEDPEKLKLWWHSHGRMDVFWSATDDTTAKSFANGWMLSVVGNKEGKFKVRLDIYTPVHIAFDMELDVACEPPSAELLAAIKADVASKVTRKNFVSVPYGRWERNVRDDRGIEGYPSGYISGGNRSGYTDAERQAWEKQWE